MVAGYQDELDSEDDVAIVTRPATIAPKIAHDIDLSSDENDDAVNVHVVKYDEDLSSEDETIKKDSGGGGDNKSSQELNSQSEKNAIQSVKPKSKTVVLTSESESEENDTNIDQPDRGKLHVLNIPRKGSHGTSDNNSDTEKAKRRTSSNSNLANDNLSDNNSVSRKLSSSSNNSENKLTNQNADGSKLANQKNKHQKSANQDSDSESGDNDCQVTVLQDTDINPNDFGGADVFNDWLNKQETEVLT